jgi:energy-coupling factor transport system permease protein
MSNRFSSFHPAILFFYFLGAIVLIMLFMHPIYLSVAVIILILFHFFYDRFKGLLAWIRFILLTGGFIFFLTPLFNERGRYLLFELFGHRVTLEAITYGSMSALSLMGVMVLFISYNEIITPNKILFLFSKFLPQFAVLLMLTLRFIPLMKKRLNEISAVQSAKGISIYDGTWRERLQKGMVYIQILLTFSLEEAIQTADSMKARSYGLHKRTTYEHFRMKVMDKIAFLYLFLILSICVFMRFNGVGFLSVYPVMESISLAPLERVNLFLYSLFLCFPLFVKIGEIQWRTSK